VNVTIVLVRDGQEISHLTVKAKQMMLTPLATSMAAEINRVLFQ